MNCKDGYCTNIKHSFKINTQVRHHFIQSLIHDSDTFISKEETILKYSLQNDMYSVMFSTSKSYNSLLLVTNELNVKIFKFWTYDWPDLDEQNYDYYMSDINIRMVINFVKCM